MIYKLFTTLLFCPIISYGQFNSDYWTIYSTETSGIESDFIWDISPSKTEKNVLFLSSKEALTLFNIKSLQTPSLTYPTLPKGVISDIVELVQDSQIIVSSLQNGIAIRNNEEWKIYNHTNSEIKNDTIYEMLKIDTEIFFASPKTGLFSFQNYTFRDFSPPDSNLLNACFSLTNDDQGNIWIAGKGTIGVLDLDKNSWKIYDPFKDDSLFAYTQRDIFYDNHTKTVWVAAPTFKGFYSIIDESFSFFNKSNLDIKNDIIWKITKGPFNNLWIGSQEGLIIFDPKEKIVKFNLTKDNSPLINDVIRSIYLDPNSATAYFGTWGGGLAKWEYGKDPEFMAVMNGPPIEKPAKINIHQEANSLSLQNLLPKSKVSIFNLKGQLIYSTLSNSNSLEIKNLSLISGVYLLKVEHENGTTTQKFVFTQNH